MIIVDGQKIANEILINIRRKIADRSLGMAAILVGEDEGLKKFVQLKKKAAEAAGIQFSIYEFESQVTEAEILDTIGWLANDDMIQGIIIELPLPKNLDAQKIINAVPEEKDIDCLTSGQQIKFYSGKKSYLPPAVGALEDFFKSQKIVATGKKVAVFGHGMLVGKPIAYWLNEQGAQVSVIDEFTSNPEHFALNADIVISGVGKPGLIGEDMIKEGAIVIDYGYGKKAGKALGDVDFESVAPKTSLITPVPGGMGPLVVMAMLENLTQTK